MANVEFGSIVTQINGSVGGQTFQKNRFGHTLKNKNTMCKPNSEAQNASKVILSDVARYWQMLSNEQRTGWDTYAQTYPSYPASGSSVAISGYNLFCKYNYYRRLGGLDLLADATLTNNPYSIVDPAFSVDGNSDLSFEFPNPSASDFNYQLYVSPPLKSSSNFNNGKLRLLFTGEYVTTAFEPVTFEYEKLFGRVPVLNDELLCQFIITGSTFPQVAVFPPVRVIVATL